MNPVAQSFASFDDVYECAMNLRPCPFCGTASIPKHDFYGLYIEHYSPNCILHLFHLYSYSEAVLWNQGTRIAA